MAVFIMIIFCVKTFLIPKVLLFYFNSICFFFHEWMFWNCKKFTLVFLLTLPENNWNNLEQAGTSIQISLHYVHVAKHIIFFSDRNISVWTGGICKVMAFMDLNDIFIRSFRNKPSRSFVYQGLLSETFILKEAIILQNQCKSSLPSSPRVEHFKILFLIFQILFENFSRAHVNQHVKMSRQILILARRTKKYLTVMCHD